MIHILLLGLAIVPAVMQMVLLPVCPESPRYLLMSRQLEDEARRGRLIHYTAAIGSSILVKSLLRTDIKL